MNPMQEIVTFYASASTLINGVDRSIEVDEIMPLDDVDQAVKDFVERCKENLFQFGNNSSRILNIKIRNIPLMNFGYRDMSQLDIGEFSPDYPMGMGPEEEELSPDSPLSTDQNKEISDKKIAAAVNKFMDLRKSTSCPLSTNQEEEEELSPDYPMGMGPEDLEASESIGFCTCSDSESSSSYDSDFHFNSFSQGNKN